MSKSSEGIKKKKFINFLFCEASLCSSQIELYYTHKKRKDSFCSSYKEAINNIDWKKKRGGGV